MGKATAAPAKEAESALVRLYVLGQIRCVWQSAADQQTLEIQPRPFHLLAYMAMDPASPHRREELRALFWPEKSPSRAANNLRQALWHLRQALPTDALLVQADTIQWNPGKSLWVDAQAFEEALDEEDLDAALNLYAGPLLPDCYDEWAQLERERLHLHYLAALESRAHQRYVAGAWQAALEDTEALLSADPLNEVAVRLLMACHWALGQREAARRRYAAFRQRVADELQCEPLPETTALYQRILRGELHPDQAAPPAEEAIAAHRAHFSLLETLGAFRQGLEQAADWAAGASGLALAAARRWQGRFHLRMGQLADAYAVLLSALPVASAPGLRAAVLADLAGVEVARGDYGAAETHYKQALLDQPQSFRARVLSSLGGLQGRLGRSAEARASLEEAIRLIRGQGNPAALAVASGNLGILLIGQGEVEGAQAALQEALAAARRAEAHWLTAHLTGHLGVLAQDRGDLDTAARHYQGAHTLAETIGDRRSVALWTLNLGVVYYEQGRWAEAMALLTAGQREAAEQGSRSLEAGATTFIGACLVGQGRPAEGLAHIERGLSLAREIGDQERILIGLLQQGRALAAMGRLEEAGPVLREGLQLAQTSHMHRLEEKLRAEWIRWSPLP